MDWSRIGEGDPENHPEQHPPELTEHDEYVYRWYALHCTQFSMDFHILSVLLEEIGLEEDEKTLFLYKLNMIYTSDLEIQRKEREKERAKNANRKY